MAKGFRSAVHPAAMTYFSVHGKRLTQSTDCRDRSSFILLDSLEYLWYLLSLTFTCGDAINAIEFFRLLESGRALTTWSTLTGFIDYHKSQRSHAKLRSSAIDVWDVGPQAATIVKCLDDEAETHMEVPQKCVEYQRITTNKEISRHGKYRQLKAQCKRSKVDLYTSRLWRGRLRILQAENFLDSHSDAKKVVKGETMNLSTVPYLCQVLTTCLELPVEQYWYSGRVLVQILLLTASDFDTKLRHSACEAVILVILFLHT